MKFFVHACSRLIPFALSWLAACGSGDGTVSSPGPAQLGGSGNTSLNLQARLEPLPEASRASLVDHLARRSVLADPDWYVWGGSPIRGPDGRYHLFYSRWRRDNPRAFRGWLYESEIARAVADRPAGPYTHVETVLRGRGGDAWDASMVHNPNVRLFEGKYYLYHIGTRDDDNRSSDWQDHQYGQRIGVAVADRPEGPWTRFDHPLVEPQPDGAIYFYVTNPTVERGPDGVYRMLLKGKTRDDRRQTIHGVAVGETPLGPFRILPEALLTDAPAEDPYLWYDGIRRRFFAVFKDWVGTYTGSDGGLALMESYDGRRWRMAASPTVSLRRLTWTDGGITSLSFLERPQFLLDTCGQPAVLFAAAAVGDVFDNALSFNVHIPVSSDCPLGTGDAAPGR